jgi:beta-aspartyl-dipeptidase (metallo-type)
MYGGRMLEAVLIHNAEVFDPAPRGHGAVLTIDGKIAAVGALDLARIDQALRAVDVTLETVDARGCVITPGLIDPHEHLLGSSGEKGFSSRGPEIFCVELTEGAITTVVGTLGTDNTMRTMAELLAKVKALEEEGLSAYMYSGGYTLPPMTLMGSLRNDLMFIGEVIGAGEIAISDRRAVQPDPRELAAVITEAYVGGMLSRKAGVTHVHVGEGDARLRPIVEALDGFELDPRAIYPTHVTRSPELLAEAAALTRRGSFVDIDTTERKLPDDLHDFVGAGGDLAHLTISTDAGSSSPRNLLEQIAAAVAAGWSLEEILPLATTNTAAVLKLTTKGRLAPGCDGDVVALRRGSLEPAYVIARGRIVMREGRVVKTPTFLEDSNRQVTLSGNAD